MVCQEDRETLRSLAGTVRELCDRVEVAEHRRLWYAHNALQAPRPMVLCFPEGSWRELLPAEAMTCRDEKLRGWEYALRSRIYWWKHIRDDHTLEPWFDLNWQIGVENATYGVEIPYTQGENRGSYVWEPPFKDLSGDLARLRPRHYTVNREATQRDIDLAQELFGDLLPPRLHGSFWWTLGLTWEAIKLVGLEGLMLAMYDDPAGLHGLMAFLRDQQMAMLDWCEREGLLTLNNTNGYTGSGGVAYTRELPQPDCKPGDKVRLIDLWGFGESQETVGVSPAMFEEFILPYQVPLLKRFGLNCYGCCEPVHLRIDAILKQVPRIRRVSVSPWTDQQAMAQRLGHSVIFSRKPNPAMICASFDEQVIRADLRQTLAAAGDQPLEIIMKDTHTVQGQAWRISRWVEIALEEVDRFISGSRKVA